MERACPSLEKTELLSVFSLHGSRDRPASRSPGCGEPVQYEALPMPLPNQVLAWLRETGRKSRSFPPLPAPLLHPGELGRVRVDEGPQGGQGP